MAIEFQCPDCRELLRVGDAAAGSMVECGACRAAIRVPEPPRIPVAEVADADDEFDFRPRRRRVAPPPKKGRSTVFWLVVVVLGLFGFTALACGGLVLVTRTPHWRVFESARGGYRVDLPADPRDDMADRAGGDLEPGAVIEGTVLFGRLEEYAVVFMDIPPPGQRAANDEEAFDQALKQPMGGNVRRVIRADPITVSGFPAREVELELDNGSMGAARLVLAETKLYVVIAGGQTSEPMNERVRRFLDSFEVTDPAQLAARKNREAGIAPPVRPVPRAPLPPRPRKGSRPQ